MRALGGGGKNDRGRTRIPAEEFRGENGALERSHSEVSAVAGHGLLFEIGHLPIRALAFLGGQPGGQGAAAHFGAWLGRVPMQAPRLPILFNVSGAPAESPEEIRAHLDQALARPVRWTACMAAIRAREPQLLFEVGPGGVLAALARANGFGEAIHILRVNNLRGVELAAKTVTGADS